VTLSNPGHTHAGGISALQFEAVRLACERHSQTLPNGSKAGFFLGDGEPPVTTGILSRNPLSWMCIPILPFRPGCWKGPPGRSADPRKLPTRTHQGRQITSGGSDAVSFDVPEGYRGPLTLSPSVIPMHPPSPGDLVLRKRGPGHRRRARPEGRWSAAIRGGSHPRPQAAQDQADAAARQPAQDGVRGALQHVSQNVVCAGV